MKILIVYEEVPESTKFYTVEVSPDEWEWMRKTHSHFVNGTDNLVAEEACNRLTTWLENHKPSEPEEPILLRGEGFDYVLHTGFLL